MDLHHFHNYNITLTYNDISVNISTRMNSFLYFTILRAIDHLFHIFRTSMTHDLIIYEFGQMRVDGDHGRNGDWPRDLFRKPTSTDTDARLSEYLERKENSSSGCGEVKPTAVSNLTKFIESIEARR
ncbi:hypothetical protein V1477_006586 [Vespula maculifrons]|uniref:Uncharacterized protein n=1 Tax=Vespula maculifrons TaxID=7453 RepID=A0ABD2CKD1_VESMC